MNNDNNSKGLISCLVILLIAGVAVAVISRLFWLILPVLLIVNLIRAVLRHSGDGKQPHTVFRRKQEEEKEKYCEAEFEVIDDEHGESK